MGNIRSFATLRISVTNVSKSTEWYKKLFNQEPVEVSDKFVSFKIGETCFDIAQADSISPATNGGCVGYWLVDDLSKVLEKVESVGATIYRGPLDVPEIERTILQIKDPFGNIIGFEGILANSRE